MKTDIHSQKILILDVPEDKVNDVVNGLRALELEALVGAVMFAVIACNFQLRFRHVDANHPAMRANQLRQRINIAPRAAAEVENLAAFKQFRADQPATVIARQYFRVNTGQQLFQPGRHGIDIATGGGTQVVARLQLVAVIVFDDFMHGCFP